MLCLTVSFIQSCLILKKNLKSKVVRTAKRNLIAFHSRNPCQNPSYASQSPRGGGGGGGGGGGSGRRKKKPLLNVVQELPVTATSAAAAAMQQQQLQAGIKALV